MTPLTRAKLLLAATALGIWAVGVRMGDERLQWAGMAVLAVAFLLRLVKDRHVDPKRGPKDRDSS